MSGINRKFMNMFIFIFDKSPYNELIELRMMGLVDFPADGGA